MTAFVTCRSSGSGCGAGVGIHSALKSLSGSLSSRYSAGIRLKVCEVSCVMPLKTK